MSKKRCFFLKGFDIQEVDKKYGLCIISNIEVESVIPTNKTSIIDVIEKQEETHISFVDEKNDKCFITMLDWINNEKFHQSTDIACYWCKHQFSTKPLGCPIKFINNRIEKSYVSHITKDRYYMKENLTKTKLASVLDLKSDSYDITPVETEYYLTDGIFCSFNCIIAFIKDQAHDAFYNESKMLTYNMYREVVGKTASKIKSAPHWRLLKMFGGPFTIDDFRKSFNLFEYEECSFHMKTLSKIFKEK